MEDKDIVELYWQRSDKAIIETDTKYGRYCKVIAYNICGSEQDAEECVNDTWFSAWNQMPRKRPKMLSPFLGKICRNSAINRTRTKSALKRGGGEYELALYELQECIPDKCNVEQKIELKELVNEINSFTAKLSEEEQLIFTARYWHMASVSYIATKMDMSENNVKVRLHRIRLKLREHLKEEGLC